MNNQTLEEKLLDLDLEFLHGVPVNLTKEMVEQIKQIFKDEGYTKNPPKVEDSTFYPEIWALANGYRKVQPKILYGTKYPDPRPCTKNSHFIEHEQSDCGCGYTATMRKTDDTNNL